MQVSRITQPARALQLRGHEPDTRLRTRQLASKRAFGKTEQWLRSWGRRADMDPAAPGRNEEERPALIYRNDPEVAKATAAALRAAVISAIAENTSVSNFRQLSFSPKAKYPTLESLQPLAEESGAGLSRLDPSQRRDLLEDRSHAALRGRRWRRQTERGLRSSDPGAVG